jgi:RimJ/RimL family protein N-acetyltransferase
VVTIEPLTSPDFDSVAGWLANADVNKWLTGDWRNREVNAGLVAFAVRNRRNRLFIVRHEAEAAGLVALSDIEAADGTAMVWYALGKRELTGKGITTEAVRQLVRLAFSEMALSSVYAWVMDGNVPSRRVLERAGFREAGRIRRASSCDGRQVDRLYFDLISSDQVA